MARKSPRPGQLATRRDVLRMGAAGAATAAFGTFPMPAVATNKTIRIGFISPQTGPLAAFGASDQFVLAGVRNAVKDGLEIGGQRYAVEILARDSQSNPSRVAEIASRLILKDGVNIMVATSTGDTVNPTADQCELNQVPCVTADAPWEVTYFPRGATPEKGFDWTYHFFWGLNDLLDVFTDMWGSVATNKKVGALFANDVEGVALADPAHGFATPITKKGYGYTMPGLFAPMSTDFTSAISAYRDAGVEIFTGAVTPPDFTTFWGQAAQQGLRSKLKFATVAKAMLFPAAVEALGDQGVGITTEVWWSPSHPFRSGLTGQTSAEFAAAYTKETGKQWTQPLGFKHAVLEVALDALKRSGAPDNPAAVRTAIEQTSYSSIVGPVSWKFGDKRNPVKNVCTTPLVGGQWKKGTEFPYELEIVNNQQAPEVPLGGKLLLLS